MTGASSSDSVRFVMSHRATVPLDPPRANVEPSGLQLNGAMVMESREASEIGRAAVHYKFKLKDMVLRGKLEL